MNKDLARRSALHKDEIRDTPPTFQPQNQLVPQLSLHEVAHVIKTCKRTSSGPSGIPFFIFREYWDILTPLYHYIWSISLQKCTFPSCYKLADLIPIPKTRNPTKLEDIRGISVTPIAARLFEKVVHYKWITPRIISIGDPNQFAYKPHISATDCLLSLQHFVLSELDKANTDGVHSILIDFSKAFDRVNQEKAAVQYNKFILSSYVRKWLYNFSTARKQRLIWQDQRLSYETIDRGCSQGTVGGPGIFSMYTDDLRPICTTSRILKYSDDTTCLVPCLQYPNEDNRVKLAKEMKSLMDWTEEKDMTMNTKKTVHLRFCLNRRPLCECKPIEMCESVTEARILGVIFQSDCSFRKHCDSLLSVLKSTLFLFNDLKIHGTPASDIYHVFEALVISRIRYGLSVYGSDTSSLCRIDKFLERCHRKDLTKDRINVKDLLRQEDERNLTNILLNKRHPLHNYITSHRKERTTRHNFTSSKPRVRTKTFLNAFCNRILPF